MSYTDNPANDYARYDAAQKAQEDKLPRCAYCDEPIMTDECYEINDELICPDCLDREHRKWTDDYIE